MFSICSSKLRSMLNSIFADLDLQTPDLLKSDEVIISLYEYHERYTAKVAIVSWMPTKLQSAGQTDK